MHPAHGVLAVLVLLELHAVALQPLHHREAAGRGLVDGALVDDSVVGAGDLGDVVLGLALPGMTALLTPSMPIASAPEWRTWAFSSSSTWAPCSAAVSAAMVPAVPPPMTSTSQSSRTGVGEVGNLHQLITAE